MSKASKPSQKECTAEAAELANWLAANWWSGRINKDQPQLAQPGRPGLIANLFQRQPCQIEPLQSSVRVLCAIGRLRWLADGSRWLGSRQPTGLLFGGGADVARATRPGAGIKHVPRRVTRTCKCTRRPDVKLMKAAKNRAHGSRSWVLASMWL